MSARPPAHVVIVGGGFAGVACARSWRRRRTSRSPSSTATTTTSSSRCSTRWPPRSSRAATSPSRCARSPPRRLRGQARRGRRRSTRPPGRVTTARGETYTGDYLVLAAGSQPSFFGTPGRRARLPPLLAGGRRAAADADHRGLRGGRPRPAPGRRGVAQLRRGRRRPDRHRGRRRAGRDDQHDDDRTSSRPRDARRRSTSSTTGTAAGDVLRQGARLRGPGARARTASSCGWARASPRSARATSRCRTASTIKTRCVIWGGGLMAAPIADASGLPQGRGGRIDVAPDLTVAGFPGVLPSATSPTSRPRTARRSRSSARSRCRAARAAAKNILADLDGKPREAVLVHGQGHRWP